MFLFWQFNIYIYIFFFKNQKLQELRQNTLKEAAKKNAYDF